MAMAEQVRTALDQVSAEAARTEGFERLRAGALSAEEVRAFMGNVVRTHFLSPHVLAFVFGLAPGPAAPPLLANLREELGEAEGEQAHPELLRALMAGAGFSAEEVEAAIAGAHERVRILCARPLPFPSMREVGLSILLEMLAFEHFLAHHAGGIAAALATHYGLDQPSLQWFALHSEVDIRHAEEGLSVVEAYLAFHGLDGGALARVAGATFALNPIARAYFPDEAGGSALPPAGAADAPLGQRSGGPGERAAAVNGGPGGGAGDRPPVGMERRSPGAMTAHRLPAPGRIVALDVFQLHIPFVQAVAHARYTRAASDAVLVRVRDADGAMGWGESLPREYVTGEDVASMVEFIRDALAPRLFAARWDLGSDFRAWLRGRLPAWTRGAAGKDGAVAWNAAFCAVELALWDLALRRAGQSLADYLPPACTVVRYDGVIPSDEPRQAAALARRFVGFGIDRLKVKVGTAEDVARLDAVRGAVGDGVRVRADANGAWSVDEAVAMLARLRPFGLESIEQPVAAGDLGGLRRVREEAGLPVVADESLVRIADARALVAAEACDVFNVRVSKCGGITGALGVAAVALAAGLPVQVGAQVGETALLSAVGRHLAAHLPHVVAVEGSFGRLLLTEDVGQEAVAFGYGGEAPLLDGVGLGVTVDEAAVERLAVARLHLERGRR